MFFGLFGLLGLFGANFVGLDSVTWDIDNVSSTDY
jgi:hypothetical protein